jgi:tRNA (cytidine/uridine-2'-O-)-methyltransferase
MFRVVLHEPEIPNNTGNIGRTCIATGCSLDLIRPLGFDTSIKALRRAGLDYWPRLGVREHDDWSAAVAAMPLRPERVWLFTTKATAPMWDVPVRRGDALIFGKETLGLPRDILDLYPGRLVRLPMLPGERSLNLATVVCAAIYEGMRQCVARGEANLDPGGGLVLDPPSGTASGAAGEPPNAPELSPDDSD